MDASLDCGIGEIIGELNMAFGLAHVPALSPPALALLAALLLCAGASRFGSRHRRQPRS